MGINSHLKIFIGIKLDKEQTKYIGFYDSEYPDDYEGKDLELAKQIYNNFDTCYDYMCGDYLYIGKELFESNDGRYDPWEFQESFELQYLTSKINEVSIDLLKINKYFPSEPWSKPAWLHQVKLHIFVYLT